MSYKYEDHRANIFTENGQVMFLKIRDRAHALIETAGAARLSNIISGVCGDSWDMLACVDRLVELGEIREITSEDVRGQDRVFVKK
jgi:hypothetical protein